MKPFIDAILAQPSRVHAAGHKPLLERPLAKRFQFLMATGLLSGLMLLQATQGVQAQEQLLLPSTQAYSVVAPATRLGAPELVNPVALRDHSGVMSENGGMEGVKLLKQWTDGGVTPGQLRELTEILVVTQSPTVVRDSQTKAEVSALSERTAGLFDVQNRIQAAQFLKQHSLTMLEAEGLVGRGTTFVNSQKERSHDVQDTVEFWINTTALRQDGMIADLENNPNQTKLQFHTAVEALKKATLETGLNSLRVPLPMWTTSSHLQTVALELTQANLDLQKGTGLTGGVLGLKGHLNLTIGIPYEVAITNMPKQGQVNMQTAMDSLAHEWLHGVDAMLANQAGYAPTTGLPLMSEAIDHDGHETDSKTHWKALKEGVNQALPQWQHQMDAYGQTYPDINGYLASTRERLAYSFQSALIEKIGADSVLYSPPATGADSLMPQGMEVKNSQSTWQQTFQGLQASWWKGLNDPHQIKSQPSQVPVDVVLPSISEWRAARQPVASSPSVSSVTLKTMSPR